MVQPINPEVQLVQKAVNGNRKAFTTLFNRYFHSVYNYALTLSHDPAMAEDLTQEAFIRAHANLARFGPPWNFRTWIFRLARNYFIDLIRKEHGVEPLEEGEHVISTSPGPEKETLNREVADRVQNTLNQLQVKHREILVLRELYDFSYAEIGEVLDISDSYVKVLLHRARAAFQESYGIRLLLEDPSEDCNEVAALLHALHDNEDILDQESFAREHLKNCAACQERRQWLISQTALFGAFIPMEPPQGLARRILQQTSGQGWWQAGKSSRRIRRVMGIGGGAAVLGVATWLVFALILNNGKILPNFPKNGNAPNQDPNTSVQPIPTASDPEPTLPPTIPPVGPVMALERCGLFEDPEISLVLLNIPADTMVLPLYYKIPGGVPGQVMENADNTGLWKFSAQLGAYESNKCSLQGFDDRLYCLFTLPDSAPGLALDLLLFLDECEDPVITMLGVSIPQPLPDEQPALTCNRNLDQASCQAAGGTYIEARTTASYCDCP